MNKEASQNETSIFNGKLDGDLAFNVKENPNKPWYTKRVVLAPALLASGGLIGFVSAAEVDKFIPGIQNVAVLPSETNGLPDIVVNSHMECGHPDDSLSFGEAFHSQRELLGQGGVFEYHGKFYNTYYKEEWDSMNDSQKQEYYSSIEDKMDYDHSYLVHQGTDHHITLDVHNDHGYTHVDNDIPEGQQDEYVVFEGDNNSFEHGPDTFHIQDDFVVPETVIVDDSDIASNYESDNVEQHNHNSSPDDDSYEETHHYNDGLNEDIEQNSHPLADSHSEYDNYNDHSHMDSYIGDH